MAKLSEDLAKPAAMTALGRKQPDANKRFRSSESEGASHGTDYDRDSSQCRVKHILHSHRNRPTIDNNSH